MFEKRAKITVTTYTVTQTDAILTNQQTVTHAVIQTDRQTDRDKQNDTTLNKIHKIKPSARQRQTQLFHLSLLVEGRESSVVRFPEPG